MEEALRESEASFRDLADMAPVMIWTTDPRGHVTFVNEGWLRLTGTSSRRSSARPGRSACTPDDEPECSPSWAGRAGRERSGSASTGLRARDGEYRWIVDRGVPRYEGGASRATWARRSTSTSARRWRAGCSRSTSASTTSPPRCSEACCRSGYRRSREGARGALPARGARGRRRRRLVRRARAPRRARGARGRRRGRSRAARRGDHGPAPQRLPRVRLVEASPAEVMARLNRLVTSGGRRSWHGALPRARPRDRRGRLQLRRSSAAARARPGRAALPRRAGARCRSAQPSRPCSARGRAARARSALLLYTDGLVERRDVPLEERLDALAGAAPPWRRPGRALRAGDARGARRAEPGDDVACPGRRRRARARTASRSPCRPSRSRSRACAAVSGASSMRPARPRSRPTRSPSPSARRPATRSSTPTGPGDASFDVEAALAGASSQPRSAIRDVGARADRSTAAAGSRSSRASWIRSRSRPRATAPS